jgi:hypothetical protein
MRLIATPNSSAARRLAVSRSRAASRRRESPIRRLGPHRAARAPPVRDAMLDAAQRHDGAVGKRHGQRQAMHPRRDPAAVLLGKLLRLAKAAARRHGQDHFACGGLDAQGVAPRLAVPAHPHRKARLIELDLEGLRFARTAVEQGTQRHRRAIPNPGPG